MRVVGWGGVGVGFGRRERRRFVARRRLVPLVKSKLCGWVIVEETS